MSSTAWLVYKKDGYTLVEEPDYYHLRKYYYGGIEGILVEHYNFFLWLLGTINLDTISTGGDHYSYNEMSKFVADVIDKFYDTKTFELLK